MGVEEAINDCQPYITSRDNCNKPSVQCYQELYHMQYIIEYDNGIQNNTGLAKRGYAAKVPQHLHEGGLCCSEQTS